MTHPTTELLLFLLLLAALPGTSAIAQEPVGGADAGAAAPAPAVVDPAAKQLWDGFLAASRPGEGAREPLRAFGLTVFVRQRNRGSNDLRGVSLDFQAPDLVRCQLPSGRAIGQGAGLGLQRFWLRDDDQVTRLVEVEHEQDRGQVIGLVAIAKNFVALSDPARLRIERLELAEAPKHVLPEQRIPGTLRLRWISIVSPDFTIGKKPDGKARFRPVEKVKPMRVLLGLDRASALPRLLVIGDDRDGSVDLRLGKKAMMIHLPKGSFTAADGFLVPEVLHTYGLVATELGPRFESKPLQEFLLEDVRLRATFAEGHFEPEALDPDPLTRRPEPPSDR